MRGFKKYILSEVRHTVFEEVLKLNISEPINGQFLTKLKDVDGIDMKYEFYLGPQSMAMMHKKFIQQFPQEVRSKENLILINESYFSPIGGKFYACDANKELLRSAKDGNS